MKRKNPRAGGARASVSHRAGDCGSHSKNDSKPQRGGPPKMLVADRIDAMLFAYIAETRFTEPAVGCSTFAAILHPFPDEAAARSALIAAGGENVRVKR